MKTFAIDLKPESDFATELAGDCLFGQICWQLAQDESLAGELSDLLKDYDTRPFLVVSDPVISFINKGQKEYLMKRPFVPSAEKPFANLAYEEQKKLFTERKRRKGCRWVIVSDSKILNPLDPDSPVNIQDIVNRYNLPEDWSPEKTYYQTHNSIDRLTGTTGTDAAFAPFNQMLISWPNDLKLTLFFGISEKIKIEAVKTALLRIGVTGYGADASTGKGRFSFVEIKEIDIQKFGSKNPDSLYTLGSSLPVPQIYRQICFEPTVRFGKHGNILATGDYPFKQPVLKASSGSVFKPLKDYWPEKPFIGSSIKGLSMLPETVEQGYSLFIPVKSEV
ncbi:MAG: type III-A CRISPR-associated RAMP protein Csm4 [Candidatus Rifleibacteriota bacterium]